MRKIAIASVVLSGAFLALCSSSSAQAPKGADIPEVIPAPGWKTCPRCQNNNHVAADRIKYKVDGHAFDPHDLSGIWGNNGIPMDLKNLPPFTPEGQKLYEATKDDLSPKGIYIPNSKDPRISCDPTGFPRNITDNYGFEFAQLPGRTVEFFERDHTWRTIWTDGRKLPADPPYLRYEGYAVGHWEGDEFVVQSTGFDDRSWLWQRSARKAGDPSYGFPHSDQLKVEEHYKRLDYGTLQITWTIVDPKVYTKPWTSSGSETLRPGTELGEYLCVPSESLEFNADENSASAGVTPPKK